MKLITRDTDYAVRALCYIAKKKDQVVSVSDLVARLNIPKPFLRKLLQILNTKGLLASYKGKGGGFVLADNPKSITLLDIVEIFQGPVCFNKHTLRNSRCPHIKSCGLKKKLDHIEVDIVARLKSINIASLIKNGGI